MLCEVCGKNEATGFYENTGSGFKTITRLCTKCLLEKQKELFGGLNMFFPSAPVKKSRCPKCGTDINAVVKTLFLGCPDCYKAFEQYLPPIIKNIQNATAHTGTAPGYAAVDVGGAALKSELDYLNQELQAAVREARYDDAAAIDKRIKALKGEVF